MSSCGARSAGKSGGKTGKRACAVVAGREQRQGEDDGDRGNGAQRHDELIPIVDAGAEGRWRGRQPRSKVSMITMRQAQCG